MLEKDVMEYDPIGRDDLEAGLDEDTGVGRARWLDLFLFYRGINAYTLISAIIFTVVSGIVLPGQAIFLGRMFDLFTSLGADQISSNDLVLRMASFATKFCAFGIASGALNAIFFGLWVVFGELQAKAASENIFVCILNKEMAWYDTRKAGIATFVSRLQT